MPDVTKVQFAVIAKLVIGLCLAVGLPLSEDAQKEIVFCITTIGTILVAADALIRFGRSKIAANPEAMKRLEHPGKASAWSDED